LPESGVRIIDSIDRDRLATFFAILAIACIAAGAVAGALARIAEAWVFPTAGLVGYAILAARAMLLWQGGRAFTPPRRLR
jgi:quinol-cytochrome oxidoreductase complex cytochrome b subunit